MSKCISVLGSTGSIGRQTLDVAEKLGVRVAALTAERSVDRLAEQCRIFRPSLAVMGSEAAAKALKAQIADLPTEVMWGKAGLLAAAAHPDADTVITAVVGMIGLEPTMAALKAGKRIGLANKETMVCAGELVMATAKAYGAEIIPVDSEHSALFQCLAGCVDRQEVRRLILTCSGGPFFGMNREELKLVRSADALKHPTWKMGPKITIDCSTLMNKGLEVIEAMRLYELPLAQVDVVIHRQSVVHSLVEYCDGAVLAQLGSPDMRLPIQLALTWPNRMACPAPNLDLLTCGALSFCAPDEEAFPCLKLAKEAAKAGGTAGAVLSGANEVAVGLYLRDAIGFYDIPALVRGAMDAVPFTGNPGLETIIEADRLARQYVSSTFGG
ncbi:MAG: 1-deoxy-D-xylulose-5-phosphate reductoisomerase [Ruminococcaceae bacterium]|nr:1-deoxy-D-xylulose-5-phosphate reductoisomerase [Oscillospiraceae bacterium]